MNTKIDNTQVVIRAAGERTEALCKKLVLEQGVPEELVTIIHEVPFSSAMRKSFEIGVDSGCKWTFCVDADILLRPGAIDTMVSMADQMDENFCEIQGYIYDKFFGGPREGGTHLYRSSLLPAVINHIPSEGVNIRPEYHTLRSMKKDGFPMQGVAYIVGLHDSEQYFKDIYRKCFVHAHKFSHVTELLLDIWRSGAPNDPDMQVALKAFANGIQHAGPVLIDIRQSYYQDCLQDVGLNEKGAIDLSQWDGQRIEEIIDSWKIAPLFERYFHQPAQYGGPAVRLTRFQKIRKAFQQKGVAKGTLHLAGIFFQKLGFKLVNLTD